MPHPPAPPPAPRVVKLTLPAPVADRLDTFLSGQPVRPPRASAAVALIVLGLDAIGVPQARVGA